MGTFAHLSRRDLESALECVRDLYADPELDSIPQRFMASVRRVLSCDYAAYEEMNPALGRTVGANDPPQVRPGPELLELFARYAASGEHPIIGYWMANPRQWDRALAISQVTSLAEYHRSGIYNDIYRAADTEDQLGIQLSRDDKHVVAMAAARTRRGFSERDTQMLQLLRPHLIQAYRNAIAMAQLRLSAEASHDAVEAAGALVLRVDEEDRILACSATAMESLQDYCKPWTNRSRLPESLRRWLHEQKQNLGELASSRTKTLAGGRGTLTIRLAADRPGAGSLLILTEQRQTRNDPLARLTASLPPRLRELLGHLLAGDGEKQAAAKMSLSRHTVHNYVTMLYRKLDVSSRSELMARFVSPAAK